MGSSRNNRRWLHIALAALCLASVTAIVGGVSAWFWFWSEIDAPYASLPHEEIFVLVEPGQSSGQVADFLQAQGIISSSRLFRLYLRWAANQPIQAGEYRFTFPVSMRAVADKLQRGEVHYHKVTIPEGTELADVPAAYIAAGFGSREGFQQAMANVALVSDLDPAAPSLEGYLFPDTYFLTRGTSEEKMVRQMVDGFRRVWTEELDNRARELGLSIRETVTLASLIEKETARPEERALVSAVFHNRLRQNIKLACDPTVIYAVKTVKEYDGIIHLSDLRLDSPYNTYLYAGLPPGPIANPGRASILAALYPAAADYLFFVSKNDGSHYFSANYRDHSRAVREYQR